MRFGRVERRRTDLVVQSFENREILAPEDFADLLISLLLKLLVVPLNIFPRFSLYIRLSLRVCDTNQLRPSLTTPGLTIDDDPPTLRHQRPSTFSPPVPPFAHPTATHHLQQHLPQTSPVFSLQLKLLRLARWRRREC